MEKKMRRVQVVNACKLLNERRFPNRICNAYFQTSLVISTDIGEYRLPVDLGGVVSGDIVATIIEQHRPRLPGLLDPDEFM
jgi:hypothetical protein